MTPRCLARTYLYLHENGPTIRTPGQQCPAKLPRHARGSSIRPLPTPQQLLLVKPPDLDHMPDNENAHAQPEKRRYLKWSRPAWLTCLLSLHHDTVMPFSFDWRTSWFCQYVGIAIPALSGPQCFCNFCRFMLDVLGDHSHTCPQHIGSVKDAHEHILSALAKGFK